VLLFAGCVFAQEEKKEDPNKLFYVGNSLYEKRDYSKAVEEYLKVRDLGLESGNLYYNLGNSFFKLGKIGYAILNYERAHRMMPQDKDLKANLAYAKSLVGTSSFELPSRNPVVSAVKEPFKDFNLNALAVMALFFYLMAIGIAAFFMVNPFFAKRMWPVLVIFLAVFFISMAAFAIRYYDEDILKRGIVVQKEADCKYEPIDKSTLFYKLQEGDAVVILNTRSGWCQIKRLDGKIAWVKKEAIEEI
jgi:tetratricopeptide (TPR) repeat protein